MNKPTPTTRLAMLSFEILIATVVMCLRGIRNTENWSWRTGTQDHEIFLENWTLNVGSISNWSSPHTLQYRQHGSGIFSETWLDTFADDSYELTRQSNFLVIPCYSTGFVQSDPAYPYRVIIIPYWSLGFPAFIVVVIWSTLKSENSLREARIGRLRRRGRCVHCGYDLRSSTGRCPECGTVHDEATR